MNQGQQNNGQQRQFVEVSGGGDGTQWNPQANEKNGMKYDPNNPYNTLMGYYASEKELPGKDGKPMLLATIVTVDVNGALGESFNVICDTVLADRLENVPLGSFVCLSYKGRVHKKGYDKGLAWSQTNSYHNWYVAVDPNAIPYAQLGGVVRQSQPPVQHQNTQQSSQPVFNPQSGFNQNSAPVFMPPAANAAPVFTPPAQTFQQPATGQPQQQQQAWTPPAQQQTQQQAWTPPAQNTNPPVQHQNTQQGWQQPAQNQGQPPAGNPNNVFGGNQLNNNSGDLPF